MQLFREIHVRLKEQGGGIVNICLVPSWKMWRWAAIRQWADPHGMEYETFYVPTFYVPIIGRNFNWRYCLSALERAIAAPELYDGVFAPWLYPDGVGAVLYASLNGLPSWIMALGSDVVNLDYSMRRKIILRACNKAKKVICVCQSVKDGMLRKGAPDTDKITIVPNGVDTNLFRYQPVEKAANRIGKPGLLSAGNRKTVLYVGNLAHVKGPDILLSAWQQYKNAMNNELAMGDADCIAQRKADRLVVIGEGPMLAGLKKMTRLLRIDDSVFFVGAVSHDKVAAWMNVADVLCLPSRSEGMPNVVLEALACGLPVVASNVGACKEMLADSPESQTVPAETPDILTDAIVRILALKVDRKAMSERYANARSWADQARQILAIMEQS
ncbi:MAG: glycosyltransferase [Lentisphaerae bacterium]|nr:glycosyltransferase [Lentisphaerota bacterium]